MGIRDLAVTVDIPGVGTVNAENAAQDSTLNAILGAINAQSKSGGGGSASGSGFDAANRKAQQAAGGLGVLGGAASNTGDAMANAGRSASNAGNAFASASTNVIASFGALAGQTTSTSGMLGAVGAGISKMGAVISKLGDSAGFVGRALGGVAVAASGAFGLLLGVVSRNVEQFEKISAAGGSFGNSLMKFREISNSAGLSTEMMANIAIKAGEELSAFGGTTAAGAKIFAKNNKSFQADYGNQMMRMGIGFEQQGVMLAQFMGNLAASGENMDQLDTGELNKSFMKLTTQSKIMAQYNGTTLEAEREKQKALQKDAQLQAVLLDLSPLQRDAAERAIAAAEKQVAGSGQMIKEMLLTGGTFTAQSAGLAGELPGYTAGLKKLVQGIKGGNLDFADQLKAAGATITKEQLAGIAEVVKAGALGASGPLITGLTNAFVSVKGTLGKEINKTMEKGQDDAASLKKPPSKLDDNAVKLAQTALKMSVAMDGAVSGMLGSAGFNFALEKANDGLAGIANLTTDVTNRLAPEDSSAATPVNIVGNTVGLALQGENTDLIDSIKSMLGFGSDDDNTGAVPADPSSRPTVSRSTLPDAPTPAMQGGSGESLASAAAGVDTQTNTPVIPDDVADAMRSTPGLIQELTEQVRRSSEDNSRVVQQAIIDN